MCAVPVDLSHIAFVICDLWSALPLFFNITERCSDIPEQRPRRSAVSTYLHAVGLEFFYLGSWSYFRFCVRKTVAFSHVLNLVFCSLTNVGTSESSHTLIMKATIHYEFPFQNIMLYWQVLLCLGLEHDLRIWLIEVSSALGDLDILFRVFTR